MQNNQEQQAKAKITVEFPDGKVKEKVLNSHPILSLLCSEYGGMAEAINRKRHLCNEGGFKADKPKERRLNK